MQALIGLVALIFPLCGHALGEFAGIYFGTFMGTGSGHFAALVRANNTAVISFYDQLDEQGAIVKAIPVNTGGTFSFPLEADTVAGIFTETGVSGTSQGPGTNVTFSGTKAPFTGPLEAAGGYFSGSKLQGTVTCGGVPQGTVVSGTIDLLVAADGMAYMFGVTNLDGALLGVEGGFFDVSDNGIISGTLLDGTKITGLVNLGVPGATGELLFNDGYCTAQGDWVAPRVEVLPQAPTSSPAVSFMPWLPLLLE